MTALLSGDDSQRPIFLEREVLLFILWLAVCLNHASNARVLGVQGLPRLPDGT